MYEKICFIIFGKFLNQIILFTFKWLINNGKIQTLFCILLLGSFNSILREIELGIFNAFGVNNINDFLIR